MKKLMIFVAVLAVIIYFVWPSSSDIVGYEKYKADTNKEFSDFKSKN